ncbi:hypothetical protein HMPREF1545_03673 [Oscillibacter sp. KLE 1728]|nr:hypothetical protein HMPREF1545_03673 [Oscillibacter sp. KLE 1728]ERK58089.1 hypothetical protein HMPREF1546_03786 [Oscillibacter sp. KLE 1745]
MCKNAGEAGLTGPPYHKHNHHHHHSPYADPYHSGRILQNPPGDCIEPCIRWGGDAFS